MSAVAAGAMLVSPGSGTALTAAPLSTPADLPVKTVTVLPSPSLPTPTPSILPGSVPVVGSAPGVPATGVGADTGQATTAAPGTAGAPAQNPVYQPSPDEQSSLPNEPDRIAYEQQQSDVSYDFTRLNAELASIAVEAGGGSGRFGWPLVIHGRPPITQRFGCTDLAGEPYKADCPTKRWHTGADFGEPEGTPVFASDAGVVRTFRTNQGYGNYALVIHGKGYASLYAHMRDFAVKDGQVVKRGEQIGFVGSTGFSTGSHLHFEIRYETSFIDPCAELRC